LPSLKAQIQDSNGGPQLVSSIGRELTLQMITNSQTIEGAIERLHQRHDLAGQIVRNDASIVAERSDRGRLLRNSPDRTKVPSDDVPDYRNCQQNERQPNKEEMN